jgi:hypothetical protein
MHTNFRLTSTNTHQCYNCLVIESNCGPSYLKLLYFPFFFFPSSSSASVPESAGLVVLDGPVEEDVAVRRDPIFDEEEAAVKDDPIFDEDSPIDDEAPMDGEPRPKRDPDCRVDDEGILDGDVVVAREGNRRAEEDEAPVELGVMFRIDVNPETGRAAFAAFEKLCDVLFLPCAELLICAAASARSWNRGDPCRGPSS